MLQINLLAIIFLLAKIPSTETAPIPKKDAAAEESYSSKSLYSELLQNQDMNFPDPDEGKMYRTEQGAFDISVSSEETAPILKKNAAAEESYSSKSIYSELLQNQDMNFPDPDEGKMYRTEKGAMWKGKKGNVDISVSIDDKDPYDDFKTNWRKNETKDENKKKKKRLITFSP